MTLSVETKNIGTLNVIADSVKWPFVSSAVQSGLSQLYQISASQRMTAVAHRQRRENR